MAKHLFNDQPLHLNPKAPMLIAVGLVLAVALFAFLQRNQSSSSPVIPVALLSPTPKPPETKETTVVAPDGKAVLTMKETATQQEKMYTVTASVGTQSQPSQVFQKITDPANRIEVPFNTWSSDNTYFFLKETSATESAHYVVSSTTDSATTPYVHVEEFFAKRYPQYTIQEITGWASATLLIINTRNEEGELGPSFWFELPSHAFFQLSTRFN